MRSSIWPLVVLAAFVFAAGPAHAECTRVDPHGYCADKVLHHVLKRAEPITRIKINTALGDVVALKLPRHVALREDPALGNAAVYRYEIQGWDPLTILLWPTVPEGAGPIVERDLHGERSNFQLTLTDGVSIIVDLQIAPPTESVQHVAFHFPEVEAEAQERAALRSVIRGEVERELADKRAALDETARKLAVRTMARDLMVRHKCADLSERAMRDLLVVRAHRVCAIGARTYIWFSIQNRRRDTFELDRVEVLAGGAEGSPVEAAIEIAQDGPTESLQLGFDAETEGIAVFETKSAPQNRYGLRVREHGGASRVVTVDDVEF